IEKNSKNLGIYSVASVVMSIIMTKFSYTELYWTIYIYKMSFALNLLGAEGSTIGKSIIAVHRYFVMRSRDFAEKNWTRTFIYRCLVLQFLLSLLLTTPVWPASYAYKNHLIKSLSSEHF
ncbi:hypothetical protein PMAYCL1PPCAC_16056, partial [Pristionchus mayeri]